MISYRPTQSRNVVVVDVSPTLYTYTANISDTTRNRHMVRGVNMSGVKAVMEIVAQYYRQYKRVVLCLDTMCDKRKANPEYKSNRVYRPDIGVQTEAIKTFFPKFGVDVLSMHGYEADDMIYSVVNSSINDFNSMEVITGDSDIYGCMISPKVSFIGANSKSPTFSINEYEYVVHGKVKIPYNCSLPYISLFGKASNTLSKLKIDGMNEKYLVDFHKFIKEKDEECYGSYKYNMAEFLLSGAVEPEHIETILKRVDLAYPRIIDMPVSITAPEIDSEALCQFLSFFNLNAVARQWGLSQYLNTIKPDPTMDNFIKQAFMTVKTKTNMIDSGVMPESSETPYLSVSAEFTDVGGNW